MRHYAGSILGAMLGAAMFVGCTGGGSSDAPEGAGLEGPSNPSTMGVPPADISPEGTAAPESPPATSP